jgi:hypothetical protein
MDDLSLIMKTLSATIILATSLTYGAFSQTDNIHEVELPLEMRIGKLTAGIGATVEGFELNNIDQDELLSSHNINYILDELIVRVGTEYELTERCSVGSYIELEDLSEDNSFRKAYAYLLFKL